MRIAVIIPTRGRDGCLRQVLRDLNEQQGLGGSDGKVTQMEVWVVDQNTKPLENLSGECPSLQLFHRSMPPMGSHAGRNYAIGQTKADICLFIDDDVRIGPRFVLGHLLAHERYLRENPAVVCIAGRVVQPNDGLSEAQMLERGQLAKFDRTLGRVQGNFFGYEAGPVEHIHECNFSILTAFIKKVGAFDVAFQGNAYFEGTDLSLRILKAGALIHYEPHLVLTHLQAGAGGNRVHRKSEHTYWYMRNLALLNARHLPKVSLPLFLSYSLLYAVGKSVKNRDTEIARRGLSGLWDGAKQGFFGDLLKGQIGDGS